MGRDKVRDKNVRVKVCSWKKRKKVSWKQKLNVSFDERVFRKTLAVKSLRDFNETDTRGLRLNMSCFLKIEFHEVFRRNWCLWHAQGK